MSDIPDHVSLVRAPFGGWRIWDNTSSQEKPDATYVLQARAEKAEAEAAAMREALTATAEQALSSEIQEGYGPDVTDDPEFHRGYDAAISIARAALAKEGQ